MGTDHIRQHLTLFNDFGNVGGVADRWCHAFCGYAERFRDGRPSEPRMRCVDALPTQPTKVVRPPIQEVLQEATYEEANERSRALVGKGISKQAWNLVPRIREFQQVKASDVYESHPEVCFSVMMGHEASHSKKTVEGQDERIELLRQYSKSSPWKWKMSNVQIDDIIDACILAVAAYEAGTSGLSLQPAESDQPVVAVPQMKKER